jgi:glycosyltransferase involved in cell wall biosynthesis
VTRPLPLRVAHLTTVDMSLELLLGPQLDAVVEAGGDVIGISAPGPFVPALEARGVRHLPLAASTRGWKPSADLRSAVDLWHILRRQRPTVLHTHNPKPGLYGRVVGRLAGVPIVVNTVHGLYATEDDSWPRRAVVYTLEAIASRCSDAELVQNSEDVATMRRWRLAARRKVRHLGNGVDLTRYGPDVLSLDERRALRAQWGADDQTVVVGAVGRLVAEKGYPELFEAVAGLPDVRLVVAGGADPDKPDALHPGVLRAAEAAGVVVLGHRGDVDRLLGAFDVFVLASHREGQPRAAMEAAASGLPVVATDIRGCRQVVDDGVTGRLVPVRDSGALRQALEALASDPSGRSAMGRAAAEKARREFDEREVVRRVMDCYRDAAARRGISLTPGSASTRPSPPAPRPAASG